MDLSVFRKMVNVRHEPLPVFPVETADIVFRISNERPMTHYFRAMRMACIDDQPYFLCTCLQKEGASSAFEPAHLPGEQRGLRDGGVSVNNIDKTVLIGRNIRRDGCFGSQTNFE